MPFLMPILGWLGNLLGGPFVKAAVDAYKAKLAAGTTEATLAEKLATRELDLQAAQEAAQAQLKIAEIGHWYEPEKLFAYTLWVYFTKVYIYDAALGWGSTDAVRGTVADWGGLVIAFYFGKRGIENVLRIWKR